MTTHTIKDEPRRDELLKHIQGLALPFTLEFPDDDHSLKQNNLQWKWCAEAAEQLHEYSTDYYQGYCKRKFGVRILMAASEKYRDKYERTIGKLLYEEQVDVMRGPLFAVTRVMTKKQFSQYLDEIFQYFSMLGVKLTQPEEQTHATG